ncbi:DNA (cytosine-5-)-methyltransferase [bacterium]|nr:DNA (cytosine-5-)-methyltransferase [bacterium]
MVDKLKVVELFAGVGGFRLGLEKSNFEVVWSNQWEPSTKFQHASEIYMERFGKEGHSSEDIESVATNTIPNHDVLVGGFPCQDYSVASTLKNSKGLIGKKGVLWWSIHRILNEQKKKPKYLILENVDRLLKSPATQRGRDFAIMLQSLSDLGYILEWRVINAGEYGFPQRRRRVFMIGYHKSSEIYRQLLKEQNTFNWVLENGVLAKAFPHYSNQLLPETFELEKDLTKLSESFNKSSQEYKFENSGIMINSIVQTIKSEPKFNGSAFKLKNILENEKVDDEFYISTTDLKKWKYMKGSKKEERTTKDGYVYNYSEGSMTFPDDYEKPSRTIITGEGGASPSRFKHVIKSPENKRKYRRLTPVELERLNMFPDNHTLHENTTNSKRAFLMGNALVIGVVEEIGINLYKQHNKYKKKE